MTAHNSGKINWNCLLDNVKYNMETQEYKIINFASVEFFSHQLENIIKEFSKTPQKKPSSNPLLIKYSDETINLVNTVIEYNSSDSRTISLEYDLRYMLLVGKTQADMGFVSGATDKSICIF